MEEAMLKARNTLAPATLRQLQFIGSTNDYCYLTNTNGQEAIIRGNLQTGVEKKYIDLRELNRLLLAKGIDSLNNLPPLQWAEAAGWSMVVKNKFVVLDMTAVPAISTVKTMRDTEGILEYNTRNEAYAFLQDDNLFISDFSKITTITNDGSSDIVYGQSVHRDEFGISKGTFWSNNGKLLAFYRMDQRMVSSYPIVDWTSRPAKATNIRYPMAGDQSHEVRIGVFNRESNTTIYLQTGTPADQYLTNICWSPDDRSIYVAHLNREQNHMRLIQYDATNGNYIKTLFEEKDEKYTEPLVPMLFVKNNPGQFVWQSNRDGWNHFYLYDINGNLIRQLTKGNWEVLDEKGFDAKGQKLFFTANAQGPLTQDCYSISLNGGALERITTGEGVHLTQLSTDGSYWIDVMSNTTTPRRITIGSIKDKKEKVLLDAVNPLSDYTLGNISLFSIKGKSGDELYCRLYTPVNMTSGKKYPVVIYWYGGPHSQLIRNAWNGGANDLWFQYLAERGYLVFSMDVRGSDNRGKAFEQAIFRKPGAAQMEDLLEGIAYLKTRPDVDAERIGLFGWSYGGFLTTNFMLNHPGVCKVAVAGGPVIDWKYYEVMYTERYMDTPAENPDGYAATNLTQQVAKLKGKLLLIHGMQDPVVVQQHSVNFVRACIDKNVQVDYMIYPGHEHNVTGKDRAHLYQKVTDYLISHL
jgi:dipeptidyl-peptidase 4